MWATRNVFFAVVRQFNFAVVVFYCRPNAVCQILTFFATTSTFHIFRFRQVYSSEIVIPLL